MPEAEAHHYDLCVAALRVTGDAEPVAALHEGLAARSIRACPDGPRVELHVQSGDVPSDGRPPFSLRLLWSGPSCSGPIMRYYREGDGFAILLDGCVQVRMDLAGRRGQVVVAPGQEEALVSECLPLILDELVRSCGGMGLHAACLCADYRDGAGAVIISGASGAGKTTTALALAGSGLHLLADDVTLVCPPAQPEDPPRVWGLRSPQCKVLPGTMTLLPWLARLPAWRTIASGERAVETASLAPPGRQPTLQPRLLLLLDKPNPGGHRLLPLDKPSALVRLKAHLRLSGSDASTGPGAFSILTRLIGACRICSLSAGPDVAGLAGLVRPILAEGPC